MEAALRDEEEDGGPAGYYMDANGMLVMGSQSDTEGGYGEPGQEDGLLGEGVAAMRRDLSGEAYEWLPQQKSQGSDEVPGQYEAPATYGAYDAQQYASSFGGGAFAASGAWGSAGAEEEAEAEWDQTDTIALEPAPPFDEWNFGGTVAVHTR